MAAAAVALGVWGALRPDPLVFEAWVPEPLLRALPAGPVSVAGSPALIGLSEPTAPPPRPPPKNMCAALFGEAAAGDVPVAFFTDHYCPNCRTMAESLQGLSGVSIAIHELPILGPASETAARAALAAGLQGARERFHDRMRRASFSPTAAYLRDLAESIGLDPGQLLADAASAEVEGALARDAALAGALGFSVVPATIIGRTVVIGDTPQATLARLVEAERSEGAPCPLDG